MIRWNRAQRRTRQSASLPEAFGACPNFRRGVRLRLPARVVCRLSSRPSRREQDFGGGCNAFPAVAALPDARRKPRLLLRLSGLFLLRFPDLQLFALLFQLPPQLTRLSSSSVCRRSRSNGHFAFRTVCLHARESACLGKDDSAVRLSCASRSEIRPRPSSRSTCPVLAR